jgi:hypothetical protein
VDLEYHPKEEFEVAKASIQVLFPSSENFQGDVPNQELALVA